ncbi:hypothetical protein [Arthrobacter gengyunqii]|uniref:Uncharacterized protein n=1 Tax=Arthrobacter gengyunqii TaxID=2886940 RepID=A0ABS8GF80_9MICC|nr:hypothetical protein [Arthrobacter gengyunqii]MCC3265291.1 hypothetical protein [Arthrobacter gengyunqii]
MSQTQMVRWIKGFSNQGKARTVRAPMIYTITDWWYIPRLHTDQARRDGGFPAPL